VITLHTGLGKQKTFESAVMEISSCFGNIAQGHYVLSSTLAKWEGKPKNTLTTRFQNSPIRGAAWDMSDAMQHASKTGFWFLSE